ncbi:MAG: WG repeat-containing protein [Bacteroidota bacterium]
MRTRYYLLLITLLSIGCNPRNSVTTNEIILNQDNLSGVQSKNGKLLIDSIYKQIRTVQNHEKLLLPPMEDRIYPDVPEYYLVSDQNNQKALFDKNGALVFGFIDCFNIVIDQHTQTIVVSTETSNNVKPGKFLYNTNGDLLFETQFDNIGYISNADLIVLFAKDTGNKEFYLYNPFSKKKLGPYDHLNIYNEDNRLLEGMKESVFETIKTLNIITVRKEKDNDYLWGMINSKGNEVLPLEYRNLRLILEQDRNHPAFKKAAKPGDIEFIFTGSHFSKPSTAIFFDSNFSEYELKMKLGETMEHRIEKK